MTSFTQIPIVDLSELASPDSAARLGARIGQICHEVGFLLVTNHNIPASLTKAAFDLSKQFFALPEQQKRQIDKRKSRHFRGWEPTGTEHTNNRPDIREQIDLWSEHEARAVDVEPAYLRLLGPNQWLADNAVPGFEATVRSWISEVEQLARQLLELMAIGLELPPAHFETLFGDEQMSLTKLIHYPPTPVGQFGVNAHHDAGILTILAPGITPGLEIQNSDGDWIPVPGIDGTLVVNLGEVMQKMTGNYFVATPHRVTTTEPRHSMGYFHGPSLSTRLRKLPLSPRFSQAVAASPHHANAGFMPQSAEVEAGVADMSSDKHPDLYGEQLWNYFSRSYPDNVAYHYPNDSKQC